MSQVLLKSGLTWLVDIIADVLLIATPLSMLRDMSMPRAQKRLVLTGFAASMVTSLASVALTVFLISPPEWGPNAEHLVLMLSHVMVSFPSPHCSNELHKRVD